MGVHSKGSLTCLNIRDQTGGGSKFDRNKYNGRRHLAARVLVSSSESIQMAYREWVLDTKLYRILREKRSELRGKRV